VPVLPLIIPVYAYQKKVETTNLGQRDYIFSGKLENFAQLLSVLRDFDLSLYILIILWRT
jgi:hypothetical protein